MEPLNWATLGVDEELIEAVRWIVGPHSSDQLLVCCGAPDAESQLRSLAPRAAMHADWEVLLSSPQIQAVLVARSGLDERQQALRQLAQSLPMLMMFPADDGLFVCELDMIRRDHGICLMPYAPTVLHPAIQQMARWIEQGEEAPLGAIEQVVFERTAADRSKSSVLEIFARDALILEALGGRLQQLGALGASPGGEDYAQLSVHLVLQRGTLARWSIHPGDGPAGGSLALIGRRGTVRLALDGDPRCWSLDRQPQPPGADRWEPAGAMIGHFRQSLDRTEGQLDWSWAYRAMEAAEGVETSCRRGRVVEFLGQTVTDETTFKGMMAAGGCLLLLASLAVLLVVLVVDALQLPMRQWWVWRQWPWLLAVPFVAFLLLQGLQLVFPGKKPAAAPTQHSR